MAIISLYTGLYGKDLVKYEMNSVDFTSGVWQNPETQPDNFDYQLTGAYKSINAFTSGENWCFGITIPLRGTTYIQDTGTEICPLLPYNCDESQYESGAFSLAAQRPADFNIYFNDYCTPKSLGNRNWYLPCQNSEFTENQIFIPKKGYMTSHFYTFGEGYFSLKHLWTFTNSMSKNINDRAVPFYSTVKDSTVYNTSELTGSYRMGGIGGDSIFPASFVFRNNGAADQQPVEWRGDVTVPAEGIAQSRVKFKFTAFTLPASLTVKFGASSDGSFGGRNVYQSNLTMPNEAINAIGVTILTYSPDGILQKAVIIGTTLDFWQPKNQIGNWGASSGIEGGDGTFTAHSDNTTAQDVLNKIEEKKFLRKNWISNYSNYGIKLYTGFFITDLFRELFTSDFINRFLQSVYNPLSSILSLHQMPEYYNGIKLIPNDINSPVNSTIHLSGYNTSVSAVQTVNSLNSFSAGRVDLSSLYFGSFPDYEPYTQITLNLPFCGKISVAPSLCMGGYIDIIYTIDALNGGVCVNIVTTDRNDVSYPAYSVSGNCAYSLPVIGQQGGDYLKGFINTGISAAATMITKSPLTYLGTVKSAFDTVSTSHYTQSTGSVSGNISLLDDWTVWCEISRPEWSNPEKYSQLIGIPSDVSGTINSNDADFSAFTGFLKCKRFEAQGISGATDKEKDEIEKLLTSGIYI